MKTELLLKLQDQVRIGGKGTPRRKLKKLPSKTQNSDDKKIQAVSKKLGAQTVFGIEEVNFFMENESIIHFKSPKLSTSINSNTFFIQGNAESKELTELAPNIIEQLSPDSLEKLRQMANLYAQMTQKGEKISRENIPDLIKTFEDTQDGTA